MRESELTAYEGGYLMVGPSDATVNSAGVTPITDQIVDSDLTSASGKYVVVRGC